MRTKGGLMGYPNPHESEYDLFMTGHAGCSVSTALGLKSGDELLGEGDRHSVAVIGDGAFPSGIVYEALNNAGGLKKKLLVILNDNKMSICPRVGGMADYLDRLRMNPSYSGLKTKIVNMLNKVPLVGDPVEQFLCQFKESVKAGLHGGMLFEELGFRYIGPIDGHNIRQLLQVPEDGQRRRRARCCCTWSPKRATASSRPPKIRCSSTPAAVRRASTTSVVAIKNEFVARRTPTSPARRSTSRWSDNPRVTVLTAAMCQGNKLETVRDAFPDRFFDTGICESHAVAFAAGQAKAGLRPIVDIYSTFLQRSYDQIFQEVALQNLPVTFMLDRAGLTGPDGPTHHGCFDLGYMRVFPNMVVMAPGDAADLPQMLDFALVVPRPGGDSLSQGDGRRCRQTRGAAANAGRVGPGRSDRLGPRRHDHRLRHAVAELLEGGGAVARRRAGRRRDQRPLRQAARYRDDSAGDRNQPVRGDGGRSGADGRLRQRRAGSGHRCRADRGHVRRLGIPDRFIEHAERGELLADLGLDAAGIARKCRELAERVGSFGEVAERQVS